MRFIDCGHPPTRITDKIHSEFMHETSPSILQSISGQAVVTLSGSRCHGALLLHHVASSSIGDKLYTDDSNEINDITEYPNYNPNMFEKTNDFMTSTESPKKLPKVFEICADRGGGKYK